MTRITSALLAFVAAALILVGGLTLSWWTQPGEPRQGSLRWSIGLREAQLCGPERCTRTTLDRIEWSEPWFRAGTAAYAAALLAGGLLVAAASGLALGRSGGSLLTATALVAVVSAGVTGVLFVWLLPDYPDIAAGHSMYAFFAGALAGTLACLLGLRMPASGRP